jgi:hypothetical protein
VYVPLTCVADATGGVSGAVAAGHVTNYAQNENGDVWGLDMFKSVLGEEPWKVRGLTGAGATWLL